LSGERDAFTLLTRKIPSSNKDRDNLINFANYLRKLIWHVLLG
jgi:hypothetical protein